MMTALPALSGRIEALELMRVSGIISPSPPALGPETHFHRRSLRCFPPHSRVVAGNALFDPFQHVGKNGLDDMRISESRLTINVPRSPRGATAPS